jgi:hypothetical protein
MVAGIVAVAVVDRLEAVEVDEEQGRAGIGQRQPGDDGVGVLPWPNAGWANR